MGNPSILNLGNIRNIFNNNYNKLITYIYRHWWFPFSCLITMEQALCQSTNAGWHGKISEGVEGFLGMFPVMNPRMHQIKTKDGFDYAHVLPLRDQIDCSICCISNIKSYPVVAGTWMFIALYYIIFMVPRVAAPVPSIPTFWSTKLWNQPDWTLAFQLPSTASCSLHSRTCQHHPSRVPPSRPPQRPQMKPRATNSIPQPLKGEYKENYINEQVTQFHDMLTSAGKVSWDKHHPLFETDTKFQGTSTKVRFKADNSFDPSSPSSFGCYPGWVWRLALEGRVQTICCHLLPI